MICDRVGRGMICDRVGPGIICDRVGHGMICDRVGHGMICDRVGRFTFRIRQVACDQIWSINKHLFKRGIKNKTKKIFLFLSEPLKIKIKRVYLQLFWV